MKIQFEMNIEFPKELEEGIQQNKEKYLQELLESMREGCKDEFIPISVKLIDLNNKAIECLEKVKELIIKTYEPTPKSTKITRYINQLISELKGEKDE